ncbi:AAA family ATPase [Metabacillus halosaccharovorans]|uniref:AAA family ATPase n=1 Tax=Metabacillus halosaccharovorans TaxID=930124 RepID=UPI0009953898|nr:AAA family ATPase [Metabacillus halosaccharovorans]
MAYSFKETLEILNRFFQKIDHPLAYRLNLSTSNSYDGIFIKKLAESNTLTKNRGKQKHIAFSSEHEINFFPYLDNFVEVIAKKVPGYNSNEFKRRYGVKINIHLLKENLEYKTHEESTDISCFTTHYLSRGGNQSEMGSMYTDSKEFTDFRRLFDIGDTLIFLKHRYMFSYDLIVINNDDYAEIEDTFKRSFVAYDDFSPTRQTSTLSSPEEWGDDVSLKPATPGVNLIIYGAPGTGKSHELDKRYSGKNSVRVTFHPEYTYHDFVGSYRPQPIYKVEATNTDTYKFVTEVREPFDKGEPYINYNFIPGPFTLSLEKALRSTKEDLNPQMYTLIIEEINRANAPSVFGDLFQLLDRQSNGESTYGVSNLEIIKYLKDKRVIDTDQTEIRIPLNLNIVATMNSADQGVFVMDSAFKRRWFFEYMPIDPKKAVHKDENVAYNKQLVRWSNFIESLNDLLAAHTINEDRHIGPYFLKPGEPSNNKIITSKLLMYLWDDAARLKRSKIFIEGIKTFSQLVKLYNEGIPVFQTDFQYIKDEYNEPLRSSDNDLLDDQSIHPDAPNERIAEKTIEFDLGVDNKNE